MLGSIYWTYLHLIVNGKQTASLSTVYFVMIFIYKRLNWECPDACRDPFTTCFISYVYIPKSVGLFSGCCLLLYISYLFFVYCFEHKSGHYFSRLNSFLHCFFSGPFIAYYMRYEFFSLCLHHLILCGKLSHWQPYHIFLLLPKTHNSSLLTKKSLSE